jgi:hypothetical protein
MASDDVDVVLRAKFEAGAKAEAPTRRELERAAVNFILGVVRQGDFKVTGKLCVK